MLGQTKYKPNNSYLMDDTVFGDNNDSYSNSKRCVFEVGAICRLQDCNFFYGKRCMSFKCPLYTTKMSDKYTKLNSGSYISKKYLKEKRKK